MNTIEEVIKYSVPQYIKDAMCSRKEHENKSLAILDWFLGLMGESQELYEELEQRFAYEAQNFDAIVKELGDNIWYFVAIMLEFGFEIPELEVEANVDVAMIQGLSLGMKEMCFKLSEDLKHHICHQEDMSVEIKALLETYWTNLQYISAGMKYNFLAVMELNGAKLQHRYGGSFDIAKSADRHRREAKFTNTPQYKEIMKKVLNYV